MALPLHNGRQLPPVLSIILECIYIYIYIYIDKVFSVPRRSQVKKEFKPQEPQRLDIFATRVLYGTKRAAVPVGLENLVPVLSQHPSGS